MQWIGKAGYLIRHGSNPPKDDEMNKTTSRQLYHASFAGTLDLIIA